MSRLPRNRELEHMLIDVLRSTPVESPDRHEAWQVYADWLLGLGEPVGEWLAASLRADDGSEAAAPIRAALHEIEAACRFRLVDLELADLSEVPELARIADLTWERGFITTAAVHCRKFRAFDSELLGHTPDRLLEVVLRSPSAAMLHRLELDTYRFVAVGSRVGSFATLLAALPEDLPLRELALGDLESDASADHRDDPSMHLQAQSFARVPQLTSLSLQATKLRVSEPLALPKLERLSVRVGQPALPEPRHGRRRVLEPPPPAHLLGVSTVDDFARLCDGSGTPALAELSLALDGLADRMIELLLESPLLDRLSRLRLEHVTEVGAAVLCRSPQRVAHLSRFEIVGTQLPESLVAALRALGCSVALAPGKP
jgi:hypothetical protein